jgi:hypothetical protein
MTPTIPARYAAGETIRQIAASLRRSTTYVVRLLDQASVKRRPKGMVHGDPRASTHASDRSRCLPAHGYCPTLSRLAPRELEVSIGSSFGGAWNDNHGRRRMPGRAGA